MQNELDWILIWSEVSPSLVLPKFWPSCFAIEFKLSYAGTRWREMDRNRIQEIRRGNVIKARV